MMSFTRILIALCIILLITSFTRIMGYYQYNIPYGYDPGFFRYAINQSIIALPGLPLPDSTLPYHEPLFSVVTDILVFIGFSPDFIVGPFLAFLSISTVLFVYLLGKQLYGRRFAYLSVLLFLLSITQFQEYWWNYWRNILGIIFLLASISLFLRQSPGALITIAATCTIHRPSALFLFVVLGFFILIDSFKRKKIDWGFPALLIGGGLAALPLYMDQIASITGMIEPLTNTFGLTTTSGTFYTTREYFLLSLPYFLLIIPAIIYKSEKKEFDILYLGFLIGLIWSIGRLFFYNRMLIFFDIFVIFIAAYGVYILIKDESKKLFGYGLLSLFITVQGVTYFMHVDTYLGRHGISREEFDIIQNLDILTPNGAVILGTHRIYTPWILGYSQRDAIFPGLGKVQVWNETQWNDFYFTQDPEKQCNMIRDYHSITDKLYIFVGDQQPSLQLSHKCFRPILSSLSRPILYETLWP